EINYDLTNMVGIKIPATPTIRTIVNIPSNLVFSGS
ncbi:MAG: hypothetical protein ACI93V_001113, partial [Alteromonadaceae bacterium]